MISSPFGVGMKGVESTSTVQSARLRVDTTIVVMSVGLSPRVTGAAGNPGEGGHKGGAV